MESRDYKKTSLGFLNSLGWLSYPSREVDAMDTSYLFDPIPSLSQVSLAIAICHLIDKSEADGVGGFLVVRPVEDVLIADDPSP